MNKLTKIAAASVVALGLGLGFGVAGQAQAAPVIFDDWNVIGPAQSVSPPGGAVPRPGGGITYPGWIRSTLQAFGGLNAIDNVAIADCPACLAGHFVNASAGVAGWGYWEWTGLSTTFNDPFSFDYQTDVANADFVLAFGNVGVFQGLIQWSDLAATGLNPLPGPLAGGTLSGLAGGVTADTIRLYVFASGGGYSDAFIPVAANLNTGLTAPGLDADVDNMTVPEPGTIALLGLGLAGLGWTQRRRLA